MGKELYENFSEAKEVYEAVNDALNEKLTEIIFNGADETLKITSNAQPAIMATSIAVFKVLNSLSNKNIRELCSISAGHSLGEYSALCIADTLKLSDTAKILRTRGNAMQKAVDIGKGAMYALIGVNETIAKKVCSVLSQNGICEIANDNGAGQIIISGNKEAFENINDIIKGFKVKKAIPLAVSAPFHCSLMKKATSIMKEELEKYNLQPPKIDIIANHSVSIYNSYSDIRDSLVKQIEGKVRWRETIVKMYHEKGIRKFAELGPGKVLTNLIKRDYPDAEVHSLESLSDIENYLK